jgi:hypothetical protein
MVGWLLVLIIVICVIVGLLWFGWRMSDNTPRGIPGSVQTAGAIIKHFLKKKRKHVAHK